MGNAGPKPVVNKVAQRSALDTHAQWSSTRRTPVFLQSMSAWTQKLARADIVDLYTALWGNKVPIRLEDPVDGPLIELESFPPVTAAEVRKRIRRIKSSTAGGPDNLRKAALSGRATIQLMSGLYSLILATGILPDNRTTLIPKEGGSVTNYRLPPQQSIVGNRRSKAKVALNPRQEGSWRRQVASPMSVY